MALPTAPVTAPETLAPRPTTTRRRFGSWVHARPRIRLGGLLAAPITWMVVIYLGALFVLLLNAFWAKDPFTGSVKPFNWSLAAFQTIFGSPVYMTIALRTVTMAVIVTITDAVLALPIAYYMARIASPGRRRTDPTVGRVPRQGLFVARHPAGQRTARLGHRAIGTTRTRAVGHCKH